MQVDAGVAQLAVQRLQRFQGAGVDEVDGCADEDEVGYLRPVGHQPQDGIFQELGVGKVEALVDAHGDGVGAGLYRVAQHVAVNLAVGQAADHGYVGLAGAPDEHGDGDGHADEDAVFDTGEEDGDEGDQQGGGVAFVVAPDVTEGLDVDEADDGDHDDGGQDGVGQEVEEGGEEDDGQGDEAGGDDGGQPGGGPGGEVDHGAAEAAGDGVAAAEGGSQVGDAQGDEFLVGVYFLAALAGQ